MWSTPSRITKNAAQAGDRGVGRGPNARGHPGNTALGRRRRSTRDKPSTRFSGVRNPGFEAAVVEDACRAIDTAGSLVRAWADLHAAGVARLRSVELDVG